jgi:quinol monooxygenase YgiN
MRVRGTPTHSAVRTLAVMEPTTPTLTVAYVARLVAKDDTPAELADLLTGALDLANAEAGTVVWFALRTDPTTFWIVDAFATEDDRQTHINGQIAAALMANADRLLAAPPEILPADVLAAKVP